MFFVLATGAILAWPYYVTANGSRTTGVITRKLENVRINYDDWFRSFEIVASYSSPGQRVERQASCYVDAKTYDSLRVGNTVVVHYLPNLLVQPFVPATHLAPCSALASLRQNPSVVHLIAFAFVSLLAILFLWRVLRIRIAGWLFVPWVGFCFAYLLVPRAEPEPRQPVPGTAKVQNITTVTRIAEGSHSKGIELLRPFQILCLQYVPSGYDSPVTGVDKIDAGSVPSLAEGQTVSIVYDAADPRVVRMQQGTRKFPGQALAALVLCALTFVVVMVVFWVIGEFFRKISRLPSVQAARMNAEMRRRNRRS